MEKTFIILKPDAVKRKLIGEIIRRIESKNLEIVNMKTGTISVDTAEEHYAHVRSLPIFDDMIKYVSSGPSVFMVVQGEKAIQSIRNMVGKTSCFDSMPGTIRGDYGSHRYENLIHASDSIESAEVEIKRFFPEITLK